jgi:type IV pilus assembly protein PilX
MKSSRRAPVHQRGIVMFMALILLLVLTLLGVALARTQTVEERLAQNEDNHQLALQTAEATLHAAVDDEVNGAYPDASFSGGTPGLAILFEELNTPPGTTIGYNSTWTAPGVNTIPYNGGPLASAPAVANPQFVIEKMPPTTINGCTGSNPGNYTSSTSSFYIHRITAHSAGGDGSASATVQTIHIGGC